MARRIGTALDARRSNHAANHGVRRLRQRIDGCAHLRRAGAGQRSPRRPTGPSSPAAIVENHRTAERAGSGRRGAARRVRRQRPARRHARRRRAHVRQPVRGRARTPRGDLHLERRRVEDRRGSRAGGCRLGGGDRLATRGRPRAHPRGGARPRSGAVELASRRDRGLAAALAHLGARSGRADCAIRSRSAGCVRRLEPEPRAVDASGKQAAVRVPAPDRLGSATRSGRARRRAVVPPLRPDSMRRAYPPGRARTTGSARLRSGSSRTPWARRSSTCNTT